MLKALDYDAAKTEEQVVKSGPGTLILTGCHFAGWDSARKGTPIELEGRISTSSFEVNGERRYVTEVVAFNRSLALNKN